MAVSAFLLESEAQLTGVETYREQARRALDPLVWDYLEHGAGAGRSTAEAATAWQRLALRPRILRGITDSEIATSALGTDLALPIMTAPNGRATRFAPQGEAAVIEGTQSAGTIAVLPSSVVPSLPALHSLYPSAAIWQQLYMFRDRGRMRERLHMVREEGALAVVLTVDLLPDTSWKLPAPPHAPWEAVGAVPDPSMFVAADMDDLAWLCRETDLPVVVKGVLRDDDAVLCLEAGAAALIVSNHGGNQLDTAISSADALPEVVAAVNGRAEVYVDGGIRDGLSVLKALALGARAALIGRPVSYALAAGGGEAVATMMKELSGELARAMALCGANSLADIDPSLVRATAP
ncbi:MAG: alpha-hydroxy acid oxidase [Novosphingobium sp.]